MDPTSDPFSEVTTFYLFFSLQLYWGIIDKQNYKMHLGDWNTLTVWKESPHLVINTSITSHIYPVCVCVCVNSSSTLNKFQLYNIGLSTPVAVLLISSSDLIHLKAKSLCLFTNLSLFTPATTFLLCVWGLDSFFLRFHVWVTPCLSVPGLSHLAQCPRASSMLSQMARFPPFSWMNNIS